MAGVEFNEENMMSRRYEGEKTPKIAAFLIKKGLAKDEASAKKVEIVIAVICFALAIFFATR